MNELRLLAVYLDAQLASSRVRVIELAPHLAARGVRVTLAPYPHGRSARRALRRDARAADLVLIQKKLASALEAWRWRRLGRPVVFDFDDAVSLRQRPRSGSHGSADRARRFRRALVQASAVIAGNEHLAGLARAALGSHERPLLVAPSAVSFPVPAREHGSGTGVPRVGWIGARGNLGELEALLPALARVQARTPFELVVIADAPLAPDAVERTQLDVRHVPWRLATQEAELARLDVAVMPLRDDPWNRGKCAYKLLQSMAAGLACVASPVGMNATVVQAGHDGALAANAEEWEHELVDLLENPDRRRAYGRAARASVAATYTYPVVADRIAAFLREVATANEPQRT